MRTNELILYKNMEYEELLLDMTFLMEHYDNEYYNQEDLKGLLFSCMNELLELSECHGFFGNLWHTFLTFLLANEKRLKREQAEKRNALHKELKPLQSKYTQFGESEIHAFIGLS